MEQRKIADLNVGDKGVNVQGKVVSIEPPREVMSKFGKKLTVANAVVKDASGEVAISLWNEDAEKFRAGDTVSITNAMVNEYKEVKQLSTGKFGKIELVPPVGRQQKI